MGQKPIHARQGHLHQCQSLLDNRHCDPLALRIAFQMLSKNHQATCLLVDHQHHLIDVCVDYLGLVAIQSENKNVSKDIVTLLPDTLQTPVIELLNQAQTAGEAHCNSYQIDLSAHLFYSVTILVTLHTSIDAQEFLSVLIKREEPIPLEEAYRLQVAEIIEENKRLRAEALAQKQVEQELAQQAQALARSNADLEEFAYVVSHDLQEPLRAMTAFSQLLKQRYDRQLDVTAKRYIGHIVDGGIRMKAMIDGILELSRINNKKLSDSQPIDLQQALEVALDNLNLICVETQTTVHHSALPTLYVDRNHIVQLFQNLIGNAIKFRGSEPPQIEIMAKSQADSWLFSIQDNGIGIPPDQQQRIFKLFQRLHNQQEQKGYGIGLAICKKIVEHYQGNIWLESSLGNGSVFYFTLVVKSHASEA